MTRVSKCLMVTVNDVMMCVWYMDRPGSFRMRTSVAMTNAGTKSSSGMAKFSARLAADGYERSQ